VSAKFGHFLRELGDHGNAVKFAEASLRMDGNYVRGRAFNLTLLTHAQADNSGDLAAACATGHQAVTVATSLDSARVVGYLREFRSTLNTVSDSREVRDLDERLTPLFAA
jgi:hypothetical protein